ncbi:MAG TPA: 3-oxoacyl-ACP reductase family protein [Ilumatobacter sp.]|nr:3-oxoacyl-ACP reductase family protein [Ilumatobacter sp.]
MTRSGVALVTGASRGIGAEIARRLAADGYDVACAAMSTANALGVADEITNNGSRRAVPIEIRVQDPGSVERAVADIENALGPISLLVNNAGVNRVAPVHEQPVEDFDAVLDVNLRGVFICSHFVSRRIIASGSPGSIINIGSVAGIDAFPGRSAYAASKAGVHHLTRVMALDLAPHRIRVNAVAPGYVRTDLVQGLLDDGTLDAATLLRRIPLGEFGETADIAAAVSWLAGPESRYVTGETLVVDGGWAAYGHV